jgi:hypothetical protein
LLATQFQIARRNLLVLGHDDRTLYPILQLTHIAWPVIAFQGGQGVFAEAMHLAAMLTTVAFKEDPRQ